MITSLSGEGMSVKSGRRVLSVAALSALFAWSAQGGAAFETQNDDTATYYFGDSGTGTKKNNIERSDSDTTAYRRFAFRSGTVDVNEGGLVKLDAYESANTTYGNWVGANGNAATLNINGGTAIVRTLCLGTIKSGNCGTATINLNGGELHIGRKFALCAYHNRRISGQ